MQLHEVMKQKFGNMPKDQLRMVIMAMTPCKLGLDWFDANFNGDWATVPMNWLSWSARPFLSHADLTSADLTGADLFRARLSGANLSGTDLFGANLFGADLFAVNLSSANLSDADLTGANLSDVTYDKYTIWPDGFTPPQ